uniref:Uncharacterized protein n=1 Tax=Romanomermis culicivorax TaxID=13658 RepID=A0A915J9U1_ROMCU
MLFLTFSEFWDATTHTESKFSGEEQENEIGDGSALPSTDCQFDRVREPCQLRKDSDDTEDGPKCSTYEKLLPVEGREGPHCRASASFVECAKEECLVVCDQTSGQWSEWTSCSTSCVDATGYKQAVVKRQRTPAEKGCESEQVRDCGSAMLPCPLEDENVNEHLEQEMELSVGRPEEQASSFTHTSRYTTVTVIIVVLALLVLIVTVGMAVALYFLRESDVNTINAEL